MAIVASDMRRWEPKERADVMVSELLGSWGDNELSPECLDGAQARRTGTGTRIWAVLFDLPLRLPSSLLVSSSRFPRRLGPASFLAVLAEAPRARGG